MTKWQQEIKTVIGKQKFWVKHKITMNNHAGVEIKWKINKSETILDVHCNVQKLQCLRNERNLRKNIGKLECQQQVISESSVTHPSQNGGKGPIKPDSPRYRALSSAHSLRSLRSSSVGT